MSASQDKPKLSHLDPDGKAQMVDVSSKAVTEREATASGEVRMKVKVLDALMRGALPKGDVMATARVAGIQAAKRTAEWIPLCHPLPLDWVQIDFERTGPETLCIRCRAKTTARTGVEMEAMIGVSAAALTVYDMAKAADKAIVIGPIQLDRKTGGRSGEYRRGGS